ncbi:hypothetical protein ACA910_010708 [Epithemia clementina (nom. ined.)]
MKRWPLFPFIYFILLQSESLSYCPASRQQNQRLWLRVKQTNPVSNKLAVKFDDGQKLDAVEGIGIGIDLGTTFSAVAYLKDGKIPTIIPIPNNSRTMASLVSIDEQGDVVVGKEASEYHNNNDREPYRNVKRVIGTGGKLSVETMKVVPFLKPSVTGKTFKKDSLSNQILDAQEHPTLLYARSQSQANESTATITNLIRPETISSHILQKLKTVAEAHTGCSVTRAVIGVPAYFHDEQREATKRAAEMAGIRKIKLLREPEAAALAYGIGRQQIERQDRQQFQNRNNNNDDDDDDELVLVFDLGGGTFDVSMLLVGGGLTEVICTSGNTQLGGSDFDARVADHFRKRLASHGSSTAQWSEDCSSTILQAAERVRIHLSNAKRVSLALPLTEQGWRALESPQAIIMPTSRIDSNNSSASGISNSTHVLFTLSRRDLEILCEKELLALLRPVREVALMAGALLSGDTSPTLAAAALEMEEEEEAERGNSILFEDFYDAELSTTLNDESAKSSNDLENNERRLLLELAKDDATKAAKKAQQRGRKNARNGAKQERKYRQEKRKLETSEQFDNRSSRGGGNRATDGGVKVRDGIAGRPISRVVLVGGATRMPAVGRLVSALTGTIPQKTINPDEAVALGCAVHVGTLDGAEDMGTVLNPMQAAILKAVAIQQGIGTVDFDDDDF